MIGVGADRDAAVGHDNAVVVHRDLNGERRPEAATACIVLARLQDLNRSGRDSFPRNALVLSVQARNPHGHLHGLLVVEPRVDRRLVGSHQIGVGQAARASRALRDVLTGQLEVHAA